MKRQGAVVRSLLNIGFYAGLGLSSSVALAAGAGWTAPAPMGPFGGHFDFGIPEAGTNVGVAPDGAVTPQAEYAVYQQQNELPLIQAAYAKGDAETAVDPQNFSHDFSNVFSQDELKGIDSGWELELEHTATPQGVGQNTIQGDVWALGEIQPEKLPALVEQPAEVIAVAKSATAAEEALPPCTVQQPEGKPLLTAAHTPFQEAVLDEFEQEGLDMEAMADEADRLSQLEERRSHGWKRAPAPVYFPTYMPDYALGVRRADAMDPLALIPQMRSPVQYFGFQK